MKKFLIACTSILAAFTLAACGSQSSKTASNGDQIVKIGTQNSDEEKIWQSVAQRAKKEHIEIKMVHFTDGSQSNNAVNTNRIDLNAFQHYYYLNQ